jgi:hypothetical protein
LDCESPHKLELSKQIKMNKIKVKLPPWISLHSSFLKHNFNLINLILISCILISRRRFLISQMCKFAPSCYIINESMISWGMFALSIFTLTNVTKAKTTSTFHLVASWFLDNTTATSFANSYITLFNILFEHAFCLLWTNLKWIIFLSKGKLDAFVFLLFFL